MLLPVPTTCIRVPPLGSLYRTQKHLNNTAEELYTPAIAGTVGRIPVHLLKLSSFCDPILDFSLTTLPAKENSVVFDRQYTNHNPECKLKNNISVEKAEHIGQEEPVESQKA